MWCAVEVVALPRVAEAVVVDGLVPVDVPGDRLRVRVGQQLVRVAPLTRLRVGRAVRAEAVALAGRYALGVGVPDECIALRHGDAGLVAVRVEQAQLDLLGDRRENREIRSRAVVRRAE